MNTCGIGWTTAQWLSAVIGETWSVVRVPVHVRQKQDPVCRRARLHAAYYTLLSVTVPHDVTSYIPLEGLWEELGAFPLV